LKVSTEKIPDSQVLMTIEVEQERLEEARGRALRRLAPKAKVPGFRPGKAPPEMVRRYFGEERVLDEALDALVPVIYREAVEADESIDPIARPRLVVETTEPLVVKATIPVRPTIALGDYTAVRVKTEPVTVDESRVEETLRLLRKRAATLEPIERALRWDDVVRMEVQAEVEGETLVQQQEAEVQLNEDRDVLFPGFEEQLLGHKKGDELEFDLEIPGDMQPERLAGKRAHFKVIIQETKEEVLPELNEEFAKQVGDGYETVEALRDRIRADIQQAEEDQLKQRYEEEILSELVDRATIEYPPVLLESEIDRMIHDQAGHIEQGRGLEQYLAALGKTEEQVREEFRPVADGRIRRSLILAEVADAEKIEVTDDDVEAEIERLSASAGPQAAQLRQLFGQAEGRETIRRNLRTRRTLERLVAIATQDGERATVTAEVEQPSPAAAEGPPTEAPATVAADTEEAQA
jgi:trigger factor